MGIHNLPVLFCRGGAPLSCHSEERSDVGIRLGVKKTCRWHVFSLRSRRLYPVAVPKISLRHLSRRNFDRCHSFAALYLPPAAHGSLPAVASLLASTTPPYRPVHFPIGRAGSPAPTNVSRFLFVGADVLGGPIPVIPRQRFPVIPRRVQPDVGIRNLTVLFCRGRRLCRPA